MAGQGLANSTFSIRLAVLQQIACGHEEARCAEAALHTEMLAECLLKRVELPGFHRKPLYRAELGAVGLHCEHQTGSCGAAVDQYRAGAADAMFTTDVRTGQAEVLPEEIDEQLAGFRVTLARPSVDGNLERHLL